MSHKHAKIEALVAGLRGQKLDAHYLGYFECFNRQHFYEAHEVLEVLWLPERNGPNGRFYKGLIQLAGAFVHLQKERLQPAAALFRLARTNLVGYPGVHHGLDVQRVVAMAEGWQSQLEAAKFAVNPLGLGPEPRLDLGELEGPRDPPN